MFTRDISSKIDQTFSHMYTKSQLKDHFYNLPCENAHSDIEI